MDKIYENTVWRDGVDTADFSGMGFVIKKILVHQEWSPVGSNQVHYNMERSSWDVRNLLEVSNTKGTDDLGRASPRKQRGL